MKEYYADIEMTDDLEEWFLLQEATVFPSGKLEQYSRTGKKITEVDVIFGHRKIHFYSGTRQARVFFNEDTIGSALVLMIKWPNAIFKHNFPKEFT